MKMGGFNKEADLEASVVESSVSIVEKDYVHDTSFTINSTWTARLQCLAGRLGTEKRGIERVPEDERTDTSMSKIGTLVWRPTSGCCVPPAHTRRWCREMNLTGILVALY
jgi:hypothetical protein